MADHFSLSTTEKQTIITSLNDFVKNNPKVFDINVLLQNQTIDQMLYILETKTLELEEAATSLTEQQNQAQRVGISDKSKQNDLQASQVKLQKILTQKLQEVKENHLNNTNVDKIYLFFLFGVVFYIIFIINGFNTSTGGGKSKSPVSKNTRRKSNPMDYYVHQYVQLGGTLNDDKEIQKFVKDTYKKYPELKKKVVEMYTI